MAPRRRHLGNPVFGTTEPGRHRGRCSRCGHATSTSGLASLGHGSPALEERCRVRTGGLAAGRLRQPSEFDARWRRVPLAATQRRGGRSARYRRAGSLDGRVPCDVAMSGFYASSPSTSHEQAPQARAVTAQRLGAGPLVSLSPSGYATAARSPGSVAGVIQNAARYRSSPATVANVAFLVGSVVMAGSAWAVLEAAWRGIHVGYGVAVPMAAACLAFSVVLVRLSRTVLVVCETRIRVVNWLRTYEFDRAQNSFVFALGGAVHGAPFFDADDKHVVVSVNGARPINVAALTLGNTRLGVDQVQEIVDSLNRQLRKP